MANWQPAFPCPACAARPQPLQPDQRCSLCDAVGELPECEFCGRHYPGQECMCRGAVEERQLDKAKALLDETMAWLAGQHGRGSWAMSNLAKVLAVLVEREANRS